MKHYATNTPRPASWSNGQSFWLKITRSRVRFPALPWWFSLWGRIPVVTMVWVVSRIRFKVETSLTRIHTSINSWLNPRQRSPRWRGPHHERQPAHQLIEYPSTLIAGYGREKKKTHTISVSCVSPFFLFKHSIIWYCLFAVSEPAS